MPFPDGDSSVDLQSVSCPTPSTCVAVGDGFNDEGTFPVVVTQQTSEAGRR
jgi:hypothetical protein